MNPCCGAAPAARAVLSPKPYPALFQRARERIFVRLRVHCAGLIRFSVNPVSPKGADGGAPCPYAQHITPFLLELGPVNYPPHTQWSETTRHR